MPSVRQRLQTTAGRFFKRRSPVCRETMLTQRNIYIFFSQEGVMYALLMLITFVTGINYGNNLVLGLCFFLGSLLVITIHYTFSHLSKLHLKIIDVQPSQVGEPVQVRIEISGSSKQPHRQIQLSFNKQVFAYTQPLQPSINRVSQKSNPQNKPRQSPTITLNQVQAPQVISLWLPTTQRGWLVLPRLTVSSVYPLGILRAWSYVYFEGGAWVYPQALPYDLQVNQQVKIDDIQEIAREAQAGQDDFEQLDSYVTGESLARISWSHLARGQGLLSKRFGDPVGQEQLLDYYQMPALNHEDKLKQLRYGVAQLSQRNLSFRLRLPDGEGDVGQGSAFEQQSLIRLAKTP